MNIVRTLTWLVGSTVMIFTSTVGAEVIFEENFDDQPDYVSSDILEPGDHRLYRSNGDPLPEGWDAISDWSAYSEPHLAILASDADKARGGTGKALVMRRRSKAGGWGGDAQLAKALDRDYDELYVKFWIKFQPGWTHSGQTKLFRIGSFLPSEKDGTDNTYWSSLPMGVTWDWRAWSVQDSGLRNLIFIRPSDGNRMDNPSAGAGIGWFDGNKINASYGSTPRAIPENTSYLADQVSGGELPDQNGNLSHQQVFGDVWHKMEFYVKINSAPGVQDGVLQQWMDDVQLVDHHALAWIQNNDPEPNKGFNDVKFGGNDNFMAYPDEDQVQEWYAIDDIVIRSSLPIERLGVLPEPPANIQIK